MQFENLLYVVDNHILTLTINRPKQLNALNKGTFNDIEAAFKAASEDANIKGIIVTGSGDKAFVAGADIKEFSEFNAEEATQLSARGHDVFNQIENMNKPVIAAINGFALGGGFELALSCHFRIGSTNAKLGLPEVTLGLIPGYGGTQRILHSISKGKAMEMIMTGGMIDASEAKSLGIINHLVEQDELLPLANKLMGKIISRGPVAIAQAIKVVNDNYKFDTDGFASEIQAFGKLFSTDDVREGVAAFVEKRKANFQGK